MEVGFYDLFTSSEMELEWYGMLCQYGMVCLYGMMLVSQGMYYDFSIVGYHGMVCQYGMVCQNGMVLVCYGTLCFGMLQYVSRVS